MPRGLVYLLWLPLVGAQVQQQDPFDVAMQAYWHARTAGNFGETARLRDEARKLAEAMPADAPQFAERVRTVAQFYDGGGLTARGRAVLELALRRTQPGTPARPFLLSSLADNWEQDRNLLNAVIYRELAIAAFEQTPRDEAGGNQIINSMAGRCFRSCFTATNEVQRLAYLYRQVGRRQDVARLIEKARSSPQGQDLAALMYEQDGQFEEAAAIYKKQVEDPADPQRRLSALQSLARIQQNQQQYGEAVASLKRAASVADSSERPEIRAQSIWLRQNLAMALNQDGQTEAADHIFEQLLANPDEGTRHQVLIAYANHLTATQRAAQAETMLRDELANRADLQPWEQSNLYYTLANAARMSGGESRGQDYQRKAEEKQRTRQPEQPAQVLVRDDLQQAEMAARSGNVEQALHFVRSAIDKALQALDREQLPWGVSMTADLVTAKHPAAADGLYRAVITTVEGWSEDTVLPLLNLYPIYARFLMQQQRWGDAANVIDAYRSALTTARGEGTGWLEDVLQLRIEAARRRNTPESGFEAANDFLALEERLAGTTSEPCLRALETLAEILDSAGDFGRSLPLRRQAVTTVDLVSTPTEVRRGYTRMNAAFALARVQQFDEAEQLGSQAVAISKSLHPPQPEMFAAQLQQIRQMKTTPPTPSTTCQ